MSGGTLAIVLSGVGGQGIVFAGRLLARALFAQGKHVALRYAYGAEVMGTPVHSEVVVSDVPVICPFVEKAQVVAVLHPAALREALEKLAAPGRLILDAQLTLPNAPPGVEVEVRPFLQRCASGRAGDPGRFAPVAVLGFLAKLGYVDWNELLKAVEGEPSSQENAAALRAGYEL